MEIALHSSSEGHKAAIYSLCLADPESFYTGDGNGWIVQWQLAEPTEGKLLVQTGDRMFALHRRAGQLWAGTMVGHLLIVDLETKAFRKIDAHQKGIFGIYSWGDFILTIGGDGQLKYWNHLGDLVNTLSLSAKSLRDLAFHPDGETALIGASDASIYRVSLKKVLLQNTYPSANSPSVFCLSWIDEQTFISGGRDAKLMVWNATASDDQAPRSIDAHMYTINGIAIHPNEDLFATASRDRTIKIWEKSTFALLKVIDAIKYGTPNASVNRLLWMDDYLISVGDDRKVNYWHCKFDRGEAVSDQNMPQ